MLDIGALVFTIILALVVGGVVLLFYAAAEAKRATRAFASQHGLTLTPRGGWKLGACGFALFTAGSVRRWTDVMAGMWRGCPITCADYQYTERSGNSSTTHFLSVVVIDLGCAMPAVTLKQRGALGRFASGALDAPGLRFESIAFNERFDVESSKPHVAYELIDARMIEALLACRPGTNATFGPSHLLVWTPRRSVKQLPALLDDAVSLAGHLPALVRRQYSTGAPPPGPPREALG